MINNEKKDTMYIQNQEIKKGDVLGVAQVSAIMAAKRTFETIPMCHPIFLTGADADFKIVEDGIEIRMLFLYCESDRQDRCGDGSSEWGQRCGTDDL